MSRYYPYIIIVLILGVIFLLFREIRRPVVVKEDTYIKTIDSLIQEQYKLAAKVQELTQEKEKEKQTRELYTKEIVKLNKRLEELKNEKHINNIRTITVTEADSIHTEYYTRNKIPIRLSDRH